MDDLLLKVTAKLKSRAKRKPSSTSRERLKLISYGWVKYRLNAQTVASLMREKEAAEQREALAR